MARKAKFKKNDLVTVNGWVMNITKDQYTFRGKQVVDVKDGDSTQTRIPITDVLHFELPVATEENTARASAHEPIKCKVHGLGGSFDLPAQTVNSTLDQRGSRYGDFTDHAILAQKLQDCLREHNGGEGWARLTPAMKQALTVDCDKSARIINGDPFYADNWHDKQGYAKLIEDRLPKVY